MSTEDFLFLLSLSVIVPVIIGLVRYRKISPSYRPFLLLMFGGLAAECADYLCIKIFRTNAVSSNIFILFECNIILLQFHRWGFLKRKNWFYLIMAFCTGVWVLENIIWWRIIDFGPMFRFVYSFLIVLLSVNEINHTIVRENKNLLKNAKFLICIGFIIYFLYRILYEGSFSVNEILLQSSERATDTESKNNIQEIINYAKKIVTSFAYIVALTNIIYAIAIIFIPAKITFSWKDKLVK